MNDSTALTVLDGRFPVAVTQPPVLFDQLTREWDDRKTTSRAIARGVAAAAAVGTPSGISGTRRSRPETRLRHTAADDHP